jgi:catechol 2,3-dioxygenase
VENTIDPLVEREAGVRDPAELESAGAPAAGRISPLTTLGPVHLTVADLERSLDYYTGGIGLERLAMGDGRLSLGVGERELLVLVEEPGATQSFGHTGLYHFALLLPTRRELARWLAHAAREQIALVGLSDHFVSEAIYLSDPDGHGIEIYSDRPRDVWEGQVAERMTTVPLDAGGLLAELDDPSSEPFDGLSRQTIMGHVHLKSAEIPDTVAFYRDLLGLDLMAELASSAAFLSAGGYHHHIAANTWESAGAGPPPEGSATLRHLTIVLSDRDELERILSRLRHAGLEPEAAASGTVVRDPSANAILLTTA